MSSRSQFIGGLGTVALTSPFLVACGGGSSNSGGLVTATKLPQTKSIAQLLKQTHGISALDRKTGLLYSVDGSIKQMKPAAPPPNVTGLSASSAKRAILDNLGQDGDVGDDDGSGGCDQYDTSGCAPSDATLQVIGYTYTWYEADGDFGFGNLNGTGSPTYCVAPTGNTTSCGERIGTAVVAATAAAGFILQNAATYAPAVFNAAAGANAAANAGLLGLDAAVEFIATLAVALSIGDFLALLAAVGGTLFVVWLAIQCLSGS